MTALWWATIDSCTLARRTIAHWLRAPTPVVINLLFPVLILVLFGYLLGGQMRVPPGTTYFAFLLPGMLTLTMLFGVETTVLGVTTDASRGVTDRFRSMPLASPAVLLGRSLADMLNSIVALMLLLGCGVVVGWRWHNGIGGLLAGAGLLLLFRFALVWVGIYLGLLIKQPEGVAAIQILVWPVGFLSNVFASPNSLPGWLRPVAQRNPLSSTTAAIREQFGNPAWPDTGWVVQHAQLLALLWPLALTALFLRLAVRRYRRLDR